MARATPTPAALLRCGAREDREVCGEQGFRRHKGRIYCSKHYYRVWRKGKPTLDHEPLLTPEQCIQLKRLHRRDPKRYTISAIAESVGLHRSWVSRLLKRYAPDV